MSSQIIYKTERVTDVENNLMITREDGVVGGINWETGLDIYTSIYKIEN